MSASTATTGQIVAEFTRALLPLARLDSPARLAAFLVELGWELPGVDSMSADLDDLADRVSAAQATLSDYEGATGAEVVTLLVELLVTIEGIVAAVDGVCAQLEAVLSPDVVADSGIADAFVRRLVDHLVATHLQRNRPGLHGALTVFGLVEQQPRDADPAHYQPAFILRLVHWDRVPLLVTDPRALAELAFGWGPGLDADGFVTRLDGLIGTLRLPGGIYDQDPVLAGALGRVEAEPRELRVPLHQGGQWPDSYHEAGIGISPLLPGTPGGLGVALVPYFFGDWQAEADLGGGWHLEIAGGVDAGVGPAVVVRPPMALDLHANLVDDAADGQAFRFETTVRREATDGEAMILFGADGSSRLELQGLALSAALERNGTGDVADLGADLEGLALVIETGGADPFARALLPDDPIEASFDLALGWSSITGFHFQGGARFDVTIPVNRSLGPVTIDGLHLTVAAGTDADIDCDVTADLLGELAAFKVDVERFGLRLSLAFPGSGGNLGPVQLGFGVAPPRRVGFEIAAEAVSGGGFVEIDPDIGRYSGALSLDIVSVGIDAIVVVDTQLPGDPDGWALFASLTAQFPGIPLGFGFTLSGVGGLIALNRTLDAEALASALRAGAIDDLLFPDDPVGDSAELIAQIDEYFPLRDGNTVFGPVIEIGWGSPTLITAQLGVVLSLPDGIIAVMGSVEALLPDPAAPLITLHMDSLGVIDIGAGTFSLTASLYDSKLLQVIDLSGDMAMYLQVSGQPYFLLSVGGYHPGFEPPSIVPAAMHDLRRMRAGISIASNVSVSVEAYFAVTSNSVQFGAAVYVTASVEIWPATYTAKGWFTFDVLLIFSPFKIVASMSAGVGIYSGDKELMGVQLSLQLEGPEPWYAAGTASFKFFGLKVAFELEVGSTAAGEPKPIAHPRADVMAALALPASWSETAPLEGPAAGITYVAATAEDDTVWVRPDHQLTVRQSVAPLNRTLEIVGQAVPASGEELLTITGAGFGTTDDVDGGADWDVASDWFAPAQFETLGRTDKLTRASFEEMTAGVTFGPPGVAIPASTALMTKVNTAYESDTFDDDETWRPDPAADFLAHSVHTGAGGTGLRHDDAPTASPMFSIAPTAYTLVRSADGSTAAQVLDGAGLPTHVASQHDAMSARNAAITDDESNASRLVLVPASTALEPE